MGSAEAAIDQGITDAGHRPVALVLRALGIGDLLVAVPALRALRRALPAHRMRLAAPGWLAGLLPLLPEVDQLVPVGGLDGPLPPALAGPDLAVNLHGRGPRSTALLAALAPGRLVAHAPAPGGPEWVERMSERARWVALTAAFDMPGDADDLRVPRPADAGPASGAAVLHVGAAFGSRRWPVERFAAVARELRAGGAVVVLSGSAGERARALSVAQAADLGEDAVLAGRMDLATFAALIAHAGVVVTGDTGAGHLASAFGTPSVVLFGPAAPERWAPPASGPHIALGDARVRRGDLFADDADPALLAVSVPQVLAAVERVRP